MTIITIEDTDPLEYSELLLEIVRSLVSYPERARVREETTQQGQSTVLTIDTAPDDRGKVIGKGGTMLYLLRGLFDRIAAANQCRIYVEVEGGPPKYHRNNMRAVRAGTSNNNARRDHSR